MTAAGTATTDPGTAAATPLPSRIGEIFARAKRDGRTVLIPFITAGYPDLATSEAVILGLIAGGADIVEIGVPFSDPLADGTTIQRSSQASLANGTRLADCIELARRLREVHGVTTGLILFGYVNPFFQMGIDACVAAAAAAGVDGFIVPDLPTDESEEFAAACHAHGRDLIFLVAPTTTEGRLHEVAERATGFIYCVSLTGTTGARERTGADLPAYIARVRSATDTPLVLGFGVSTPEHVRHFGELAEGEAVGSALINHLDHFPPAGQPAAASEYARYLLGTDGAATT